MNTPEHHHNHQDHHITDELFIVAAHNAALSLGWKIFYIARNGLIAFPEQGLEVKVVKDGENINIYANGGNDENSQKLAETFKAAFHHAVATTGAQAATEQYALLEKSFTQEDKSALSGDRNIFQTIGDLLTPTKRFLITPLLINANLLVYIIMIATGIHFFEPDGESMVAWGANFKPYTLNGEWWRLFTACFLHFGILHLVFNMYALGFIGSVLEPLMGKWRLLTAYIMAGIASSAASLYINDNVVSAGASGAIFGMFGVTLALLAGGVVHKSIQKELFSNIAVFVIINLFFGFTQSGIDNSAHVGGLVSGFIIGLIMAPGIKKPQSTGLNLAALVGALVVGLGTAGFVYNFASDDFSRYQLFEDEFSKNEQAALQSLSNIRSTEDAAAAQVLRDSVLPYWDKNRALLTDLETLDLPEALEKRKALIIQYTNARVENYHLLLKLAENNTVSNNAAVAKSNAKVEAILDRLNAKDSEEKEPVD